MSSYLYYKERRKGAYFQSFEEARERSRKASRQTELLNNPNATEYSIWPISQDDDGYWRIEVLKPSALEPGEAAALGRRPSQEDDPGLRWDA